MAQTIAIEIPDVIAQNYKSPDELQQDLYADIIVRAFQKGFLTIRESAKLLEMTYEDFVEWLGEGKISFISASEDELNESYNKFESFIQSYEKS